MSMSNVYGGGYLGGINIHLHLLALFTSSAQTGSSPTYSHQSGQAGAILLSAFIVVTFKIWAKQGKNGQIYHVCVCNKEDGCRNASDVKRRA